MAGVPHQSIFQKIASEFSEIYINGAQLRRYIQNGEVIMNDNGYVYVLMNPSMQNLVKIGKTKREPEERAKELSTTGVPTPFIVVYSCYFENCSKVESFVHKYLESEGFRVSSKREFFEIPIKDAIDSVMKAKENFGEFKKINSDDLEEFKENFELEDNDYNPDIDNEEIFELNRKALVFQYGWDDEIEDINEAIKCYLKALKLGSVEAKAGLEMIYDDLVLNNDNEENYKKAIKYATEGIKIGLTNLYYGLATIYNNSEYSIYNEDKAISYYKEGIRNNDEMCCFSLATIYQENNDENNASKCYNKFFDLRDKEQELQQFQGAYYLKFIAVFQRDKIEFIEHLKPNIDNIINYLSTSGLQIMNHERQEVIHPDFIKYAKEVVNGNIEQGNITLIGE